jgi:Pyruvate flavodoxin/ferredoxin oxidoreductase, thiamine diP-bdg
MRATIDGNEAAVSVAYRLNEVCCIYPITPSSPMAELADEWSSQGRANLWGSVPTVVEMQSEGGETPYLKVLSQLLGDRLMIANATGCSSIYGGNLPTTHGRWTRPGGGRPGPTRCSRTTPSSGWASGSPPTCISAWPGAG